MKRALIGFMALLGGCAALPPGASFPKTTTVALAHPEDTRLGRQFLGAASALPGESGYRLISVGVDGFLARAQLIDASERTLDLQYYIFRGDETGRLIGAALMRAAARGVRVRVLLDDSDTVAGDERVIALDGHAGIEVRIFNPFRYRGHHDFPKAVEYLFNNSRLDYRMHNKLLVADNSVALVGGRNIGNQYFQLDPDGQFADDDVFAAGPIAADLSATFDEYWNSGLAIPVAALPHAQLSAEELTNPAEPKLALAGRRRQALQTDGIDYLKRLAAGEPYNGIIAGRLPLVWAHAQVVCDSPEKQRVRNGETTGRLMSIPVAVAAAAAQSELLMVTPYFIPSAKEMQLLRGLRQREVRVRILTSSLESASALAAQSGYMHFRRPLLNSGAELYEVRSRLDSVKGSGQTAAVSRYGHYGLHAKLFVFDRRKILVGSMNFDQRSLRLNTEVGLIIDSPELADQTAQRFDAMVQPGSSYELALSSPATGGSPHLIWRTQDSGVAVEYTREPARSPWQRLEVNLLALLPLEGEL